MIEPALFTDYDALPGEAVFDTPGTHQWIVPLGVRSICVVAVGAGGPHGFNSGDVEAGDGGNLAWANHISVEPGQVVDVFVPDGPDTTTQSPDCSVLGGAVVAGSGAAGDEAKNTTLIGDGGGLGGKGGKQGPSRRGGGGGAGGYNGNGGNGASGSLIGDEGDPGTGGAAAGGGQSTGGGGVGLYGEGTSGSVSGQGGSGGADATGSGGGKYGGGKRSVSVDIASGQGGARIIWGQGREFPSTKTGEEHSVVIQTY